MLILCAPYRVTSRLLTSGLNKFGELLLPNTAYHLQPRLFDHQFTKISSGTAGAFLGIKADGTLWAWGSNGSGQLGLGDTTSMYTPTRVGSDTWTDVSCGSSFTLGIKSDGSLWSWGSNTYGQLGLGDTTNRLVPTRVGASSNWTAINSNFAGSNAFGLMGSTLYAVGYNNYGQLGVGDQVDRNTFTLVTTLVSKISCGQYHSAFIKTDGSLWSCGLNNSGQLGLGDYTMRLIPTRIGGSTYWREIVSGGTSSAALTTGNDLWTWGGNNEGQLGLNDTNGRLSPTGVLSHGSGSWLKVYAGANGLYAIDTSNRLLATGRGSVTGTNTMINKSTFSIVDIQSHRSVSATPGGVFMHRTDGSCYFTGLDSNNYHGFGDSRYYSATQIDFAASKGALSFDNIILIERSTGHLWAAGDNEQYQHMSGSRLAAKNLKRISSSTWKDISMGLEHVLGIRTDGTLWGWGSNVNGAIAQPSNTYYTNNTQIGSSTWSSISASYYHSLGIQSNGTLWAWGYNNWGQVGNNTKTSVFSPYTHPGTWIKADASTYHSAAIRSDNTLWTWGYNAYGQLGLGDTDARLVPTQVPGLWKEVLATGYSTLAIKTDGSLWAWGDNTNGQLGLNDTTNRNAPTRVGTDNDWQSLYGGFHSSTTFATKTNGSVWACGYNSGVYGDGTSVPSLTLKLLTHISNVKHIDTTGSSGIYFT